jgi:pimeloyl-ACP methyl ester carboxylesterase
MIRFLLERCSGIDRLYHWAVRTMALLLLLCAACVPAPAPPSGVQRWTTADGIRMPYVVGGNQEADVTVVLVHCWMGNRSFWEAQLPALARDYRTVTLDLPGHGEAGSSRESWTIAGYGEDVAGLIEALDLSNVVLVGHSMGGPVSLRTAARLPQRVLGIVAVDTLHDADYRFEPGRLERLMQAWDDDFLSTCKRFVSGMFLEDEPEAVKRKALEAGCVPERAEAGVALMHSYVATDWPAWFREAGVPIRAINAATPHATNVENNRKYADFDALLMEEAGHYLQMTRPERFNALLLETLASLRP